MALADAPLLASGIHLFRVDYGYPDPPVGPAASWVTLDLARILLPPSGDPRRTVLSPLSCPTGWGLLLRNADRLLAWERLRGKGDGVSEVCAAAGSRPVVLLCRFPRHAAALRRAFVDTGLPVAFQETARDGSTPPLYRGLGPDDPRLRLHLELEWVSALSHARGDAALEQVGLLLASGPKRGSTVASSLGITQGAARSYLQWMEDVALVRRDGRLFDLAHPLLGARFHDPVAAGKPPQPQARRFRDDMSVD